MTQTHTPSNSHLSQNADKEPVQEVIKEGTFALLGKVVGTHGLQGWVKVFSYCEPRARIGEYKTWYLDGNAYQVEQFKASSAKSITAKLKGVDNCDDATGLRHKNILVAYVALERLSDDEYYWFQLQGMRVVNLQGQHLGQVSEMLATGSNDVLVVETKTQKRLLIPYIVPSIVSAVDIETETITVDWEEETDAR